MRFIRAVVCWFKNTDWFLVGDWAVAIFALLGTAFVAVCLYYSK